MPAVQVNKLEITAEKQYIAAAGNGQIRLFDVNSNDPSPVSSYEGHVGNVMAVGFQKDSKWMYSGVQGVSCMPCLRLLCTSAADLSGQLYGPMSASFGLSVHYTYLPTCPLCQKQICCLFPSLNPCTAAL